jgi:hypothetical protein
LRKKPSAYEYGKSQKDELVYKRKEKEELDRKRNEELEKVFNKINTSNT